MDTQIWVKYLIMLGLTIILKWIYATCYHFGIKMLYENHSEEDSRQVYTFFKYLSWILMAVIFSIILLWEKIGFVNLSGWHKIGISLFGLFLLHYYRSSNYLMSHFINILYFPQLAGEKEYTSAFGDIKNVDNRFYLIHDSSKTNIDITERT